MKVKLGNLNQFKTSIVNYCNQFDVCCILDSNQHQDQYSKFEFLAAFGIKYFIEIPSNDNAFEALEKFKAKNDDWIFGGFSYDLKNEIEALESLNTDYINLPNLFFFVPEHIIIIKNNEVELISENSEKLYQEIIKYAAPAEDLPTQNAPTLNRFTRQEYINTINLIKNEIALGNIYECNFCMEFYAENFKINPVKIYHQLNKKSLAPFSSYFKWYDKFIISATPERFLAKRGNKLISQPIKGTAKRSSNIEEDNQLKKELFEDPKERQENVMIVDLVRNDLTKSAKMGTVKVEELFGIYTFEQVHQMISTIVCEKENDISDIEAIKNTFPMGSMTGAPKVKAMELMDQFELTKRGLYSGSIGYFAPDGDFDFNVIIRTILYNQENQYLSFQVGSAITFDADAEKEYEECYLKAKAIFEVLAQKKTIN
jgi:para-aminobenzoate synthetase component 1